MADIELGSLSELDTADVQELLTQLTAQLQELNPNLDLRRGVFHDTVAYLHAVLEAAIRTNLDRYLSARSLQQIIQNPDLADDVVVDEVLSNWGVTRRPGTVSTGAVTIELSSQRIVTIPQGFQFEANGFLFEAVETFVSRLNQENVVTSTDRLLRLLTNGNWAFTVEVRSLETGAATQLKAGDLITPVRALSGYVTSYATTSFATGSDSQTNQELISTLQSGIAAKTLSNRVTIQSWLKSYPQFSGIVRQSIIGYGDSEMVRDQHSVFPISYGGRADLYVRTQERLEYRQIPVSAVLVSKTTSASVWQFFVAETVFPGFYEVHRILLATESGLNSGFEAALDSRDFNLPASGFAPDIVNVAEGAYSAYQTAAVQFVDDVTPTAALTVGETREYVCELKGLPLIKEIQDTVNGRDVRSYAADALVKAPVPCFVAASFQLNNPYGNPEIDIAAVKAALVARVHGIGFTGRLDASFLVDTIHDMVGKSVSVTSFHMVGRIRRPDGTALFLQSTDSLQIPWEPKRFVTARTVQFFLEENDIGITVKTVPLSVE